LQANTIYCYTVDVEAGGMRTDLNRFLAAARNFTAIEVVSYSYRPPTSSPSTSQGSSTAASGADTDDETQARGSVIMQLKLYVFVDAGVVGANTSP
ncbi:MAG: hypothetical protein LBH64_00100, partial [Coriobacteriales bacterium]|nr:hypothetical protein [Coriobacteriales bacterium]